MAIKLKELEVTRPIEAIYPELGYQAVWLLLRFRGEPFSWLKYGQDQLPVTSHRVLNTLIQAHTWNIYTRGLGNLLSSENGLDGFGRHNFGQVFDYKDLARNPVAVDQVEPLPPFSVLVLQSEYNGQLEPCLQALRNQIYPRFELILVDEGRVTSDGQTQQLAGQYEARLVQGPSALARAVEAARYDCLAFTGTAAVVDAGWLRGLARAFDHNPDVVACSGPHLPLELETAGQITAMSISLHPNRLDRFFCYNQIFKYSPELFGGWLNSGFRKDFLIEHIELVAEQNPPRLPLPLFYKALELGKIVTYEPNALVRERYERDQQQALQWAQLEQETRRRFMLTALQLYPGEQMSIRRWLDKDKPKRRSGRLHRYRRKLKKLVHHLHREVNNVRAR